MLGIIPILAPVCAFGFFYLGHPVAGMLLLAITGMFGWAMFKNWL